MKKRLLLTCFLISAIYCSAQYASTRRVYEIICTKGNPADLLNMGFVQAEFNFGDIGSSWNLPTENDYLRFKILHYYILNHRKEGEHWKKQYKENRQLLDERFDKYMKSRLKKRPLKVSTEFTNTPYKLIVSYIDKSENVQHENFYAVYSFINAKTGKLVVQFSVEEVTYKHTAWSGGYVVNSNEQLLELSIQMSNYLKKLLKE